MSAVLKGKGMVWSVGAVVFTAGIVSATTKAAQQSQRLSRTSDKAELIDTGGTIIGQVFYKFRKVLAVTVSPYSDTTNQLAADSAEAWGLKPGTLVTTTNTTDFAGAADNWNVLSTGQTRQVDGLAEVDLEIEAGDEGVEIATAPIT